MYICVSGIKYYKSPINENHWVLNSMQFEKYFFNSSSNEFDSCQIECLTWTENSKLLN